MVCSGNRENQRRTKRRPFWQRPWYLLFAAAAVLAATLAVAFGGKALGFWNEVGYAVGIVVLLGVYVLYILSEKILRRESGED